MAYGVEPSAGRIPLIEVDGTYGGVYAGTSLEFSAALVDHINAAARRASGTLPGEFVDFEAGEMFSISCPTRPLPRADFIAASGRLRAVIDDAFEIPLRDHPHLYSSAIDDAQTVRGTPTYIPKALLPADFFGRPHELELFQGDVRIFGPAERTFHSSTSGPLFNQIEDGHGRLIVEIRGELAPLARRGEVVFFTDPAFGDPVAATQVNDDGSTKALVWRLLGRDLVGDVLLFNEWVAVGVEPRGERVVVEVELPNAGTGLAAALYAGHTRDTAFRHDATVL